MVKTSFLAKAVASSAVLVGATLIPGASPASAAPACGSSITTNTTLTSDLNCSGGEGLTIEADGVTLDLGGHTITGGGTDNGAGVVVAGVSGTTVQNGTITNFDAGVFVLFGSGNTVRRLVIRDNLGAERFADLGDGILLRFATNSVVTGNVVRHNGGVSGIRAMSGSNGNMITGNAITQNDVPFPGDDGTITDAGVRLDSGAKNNVVSRNAITGSGLDGISVASGSIGNTIDSNAVSSNGFKGLTAGGPRLGDGIRVSGTGNLVQRNSVTGSAANGIYVDGQPNRFVGNYARRNGAFDLRDVNGPGPCGSDTWSANQAGTANPSCTLAP